MTKAKTRFDALKLAVSAIALTTGAGWAADASAQAAPEGVFVENTPGIVPSTGILNNQPPPAGILDLGVTGVGNVITSVNPPTGSVGVCTGTLINPRAVIFAAHCVNTRPTTAYGATGGGVALSVGFNDNNLPAVINWINNGFQTNAALNIYNANQVWYDPRSLALGPGLNFIHGDIAIATLDTPAFGIPTWAMLFSPLEDEAHATIVGYGATGTSGTSGANVGINFRRRAAENMVSVLGSLDDRDDFLFGSAPPEFFQPTYQLDFDSPAGQGAYNPAAGRFDFDIFNGNALPREGTTAGGDSGGPLIVDQEFDRQVVAGVLSGGSRFFGPQPFSSYGTTSFYQPLFLFWETIVQNNPYVYAGAFSGDGSWTDPTHWLQLMDPNYTVIQNGQLVNALPDSPEIGVNANSYRFGEVCFLSTCTDLANDPSATPYPTTAGLGLVIPGGPGSTNFVPNNVDPNVAAGVRARYYDVTLSQAGETWLNASVEIDRFAMSNGYASLDVQSGGTLSILGDATIGAGLLNVDGTFRSGEMLMVLGILTGTGLVDPTFLTSAAGAIAPNGADVGTLTIQGDVVLASGNQLFIEVGRNGADLLRIIADPAQGTLGDIMLGGDLRMVKAANGPAPRHGQVFSIVLADGSVIDTFDRVFAQTGVLRPMITYLPDAVEIELRAGRFADVIEGNVHELAFANALDDLRDGSYNFLYDLYGELDVMDFAYLNGAFSALSPVSLFDANSLLAMQDSSFSATLQNRMGVLSRSDGGSLGLSIMGTPGQIFAFGGDDGLGAASELAFASAISDTSQVAMRNGISAFFTAGYDDSRGEPSSGDRSSNDAMRTWTMAGGIEHTIGAVTMGFAAGYSRGSAGQGAYAALAENDVAQSAIYGVYRFDNGAYVSGLVGAGSSSASLERRFAAGALDYQLEGQVDGELYLGSLEVGYNHGIGSNFTLTPNASLRHYTLRTGAYTEDGGEAALAFNEQMHERAEGRLGVRFAGESTLESGWRVTPTLDASLVANLSGDESGVWTRFAAAPDVSFYLPGAARDTYWGEIIGGLRLVRDETSFALSVESSVGRNEAYEDRYMARYATRF